MTDIPEGFEPVKGSGIVVRCSACHRLVSIASAADHRERESRVWPPVLEKKTGSPDVV